MYPHESSRLHGPDDLLSGRRQQDRLRTIIALDEDSAARKWETNCTVAGQHTGLRDEVAANYRASSRPGDGLELDTWSHVDRPLRGIVPLQERSAILGQSAHLQQQRAVARLTEVARGHIPGNTNAVASIRSGG